MNGLSGSRLVRACVGLFSDGPIRDSLGLRLSGLPGREAHCLTRSLRIGPSSRPTPALRLRQVVGYARAAEVDVNRWMPWLLVPLWGCPPDKDMSDGCDGDEDCDVEEGHFCEFASDATDDEKGVCAEHIHASE